MNSLFPETAPSTSFADLVAVLWKARDCFGEQHNLLTKGATDAQRMAVVADFLNWWNNDVLPLLDGGEMLV